MTRENVRSKQTARHRRLPRYTLRALLCLLLVWSAALAFWVRFVKPYQEERALMEELAELQPRLIETEPHGPPWLRRLFGEKNCQVIVKIVHFPTPAPELTDKDIPLLHRAQHLRTLYISSDQITDAGIKDLTAMHHLTELQISSDSLTNRLLKPVGEMTNLETLFLNSKEVTDEGLLHLRSLTNLHELYLQCRVTDAGMTHLSSLHNLESLTIDNFWRLGDRLSDGSDQVRRALRQETIFDYREIPLVDVVEDLSFQHEIQIRIDEQAFEKLDIEIDVPITAQMRDVELYIGLDLMLEPLGLGWTADEVGLIIKIFDESDSQQCLRQLRKELTRLKDVEIRW